MTQLSARLNLTQPIADNLTLRLTSYFTDRHRDLVEEQGAPQGPGGNINDFVRRLTFLTPLANLLVPDPDEPGGISHIGDPIDVGNVSENPVNRLVNTTNEEDRSRFIGGVDARYDPLSWLNITGNVSFDRIDTDLSQYERPGMSQLFRTTKTVGDIRQRGEVREEFNASLTASSNRTFGENFTLRSSARWLVERLDNSWLDAGGEGLPVDEVPRLGIVTGTPEIDSLPRRASVRRASSSSTNSRTKSGTWGMSWSDATEALCSERRSAGRATGGSVERGVSPRSRGSTSAGSTSSSRATPSALQGGGPASRPSIRPTTSTVARSSHGPSGTPI